MFDLTNKIISNMRLYTVANIPNSPAYVYAKQFDSNSRFVVATICDQNGQMTFINPTSILLNTTNIEGGNYSSVGIMNADGTITVGLTAHMLAVAGKVSCDITILYPEKCYFICKMNDNGALLVVADTETPTSQQIKLGDTGLLTAKVGDYVMLGAQTVQSTTNTFYIMVEASNYSVAGDSSPLIDGTLKRNDDGTVSIQYMVEDRVDMTFSALNITDVKITIPSICNYHGFMSGVNIVNGTHAPTCTFVNNSLIPLVLKFGGDTIDEYTPKARTETQMSFYCSGTVIVCAIWEV